MKVTFKSIDHANWKECICLTTNNDGSRTTFEKFICSNAVSIAQSKVEEGWITKAIYHDATMVGFTMYGFCHETNSFELCRLMIDHKYQGKGYGAAGLDKVIEEIKKLDGCREIFLSFDPENPAKRLYEKFNFKDTGRVVDDELLYCLRIGPCAGGVACE
ncbi:MAG: GNAT family N-acetyltransferase [Rhodoferax sp.]|nr:GNAT family N-acetyltransferase [Rhodoferax sp.]